MKKEFFVQNNVFLQNHWLNNRRCRKCISECGDIKAFSLNYLWSKNIRCLHQEPKAGMLQATKFTVKNVAKTKSFCYRRRWHIFTRFLKNMLLLKSHEKTNSCHRSFPSMQKQPSRGVLRKSVREKYSKFTGEHPCRSVISLTRLFSCNFAVYFQSIFS